jgi:hypothetical protein
MQIFSSRIRFLKNSRLISTFFFAVASLLFAGSVAPGFLLVSAALADAAFCSAIAWRIRSISATNSVRYTVRVIRVRFLMYRFATSLAARLMRDSETTGGTCSFDCAAMVCVRDEKGALRWLEGVHELVMTRNCCMGKYNGLEWHVIGLRERDLQDWGRWTGVHHHRGWA